MYPVMPGKYYFTPVIQGKALPYLFDLWALQRRSYDVDISLSDDYLIASYSLNIDHLCVSMLTGIYDKEVLSDVYWEIH